MNTVDYVSGISMFSTGIVLASIRLFEPFFSFLIKKFIMNCFGIVIDEDSEGVNTKTLSTFLASSLNVELVNIILKGIKTFSKFENQYDPVVSDTLSNMDNDKAEEMKKCIDEESCQEMRVCRLSSIKIKNPELWDNAHYKDFVGDQYIQDKKKKLKKNGKISKEDD